MKVLIICHEFPPLGGGAANATYYLSKYLSSQKHKVTILTSRFKNPNKLSFEATITFLPVLRRYIDRTSPSELLCFALSGILYGLFFIRKRKYDICLAIHGIPSGWIAFFLYKLFNIPYIVSLRGGDVPGFLPQSYDRLHKKVKFLTNLYWKNAKLITANSQGLKEIAAATAGKIGKTIEVIPNGIDCQVFKPDYNLRGNQIIKIIYTGRITLQKGLECIIEAVRMCHKGIHNRFAIEIIGDGPLKEHLKSTSADLQEGHVLTFADWLSKESLLAKYKESHIFILPSFYEGMSNSLLEAMACGCMIIATDIAGNNELVRDGENGYLFKPNDVDGLKDILIQTLNSGIKTIEGMGEKSRAIAQKYDWDAVTDSYLYYIDKVLSKAT